MHTLESTRAECTSCSLGHKTVKSNSFEVTQNGSQVRGVFCATLQGSEINIAVGFALSYRCFALQIGGIMTGRTNILEVRITIEGPILDD